MLWYYHEWVQNTMWCQKRRHALEWLQWVLSLEIAQRRTPRIAVVDGVTSSIATFLCRTIELALKIIVGRTNSYSFLSLPIIMSSNIPPETNRISKIAGIFKGKISSLLNLSRAPTTSDSLSSDNSTRWVVPSLSLHHSLTLFYRNSQCYCITSEIDRQFCSLILIFNVIRHCTRM